MIKKYYKYDYAESVGGATINPEFGKPRFFIEMTWGKAGEKEMILYIKKMNGVGIKEAKELVCDIFKCSLKHEFEYFEPWIQEINICRKHATSNITIRFWCDETIIGEKDHISIVY